jgi:hypothetical protein
VPITTKVVSSNPAHSEVYLTHHYVINFISDLRQVGGFFGVSTNKTDGHDVSELLLNMTINSITIDQKDGRKINVLFSETFI